jgi:hypothetical protein
LRDVPIEVTDDNVRYWMKVQLQCSAEQMERLGFDSFCEVGWPWWRRVKGFEWATGARARTDVSDASAPVDGE